MDWTLKTDFNILAYLGGSNDTLSAGSEEDLISSGGRSISSLESQNVAPNIFNDGQEDLLDLIESVIQDSNSSLTEAQDGSSSSRNNKLVSLASSSSGGRVGVSLAVGENEGNICAICNLSLCLLYTSPSPRDS